MTDFDPDDMAQMMEDAARHDPERHRKRLREDLEVLFWDAKEGHLDVDEEREVREPAILTPDALEGPEDDDLVWTFRYVGEGDFRVIDPDGEERAIVSGHEDDPLEAMGHVAIAYHRERQISKADERLEEPGDMLMMPQIRHVKLMEDGRYGIVTPEAGVRDPEPRTVVDELTPEAVEAAYEEWREEVADKYGMGE